MIVGMIMLVPTVWTMRMIMAVHMVIVMMVWFMMNMPMSMVMAVRMTVMRMTAHC